MTARIGLGPADFYKLREQGWYFVDKSLQIEALLRDTEALLFPRPRRFGKTLGLSMLRYFLEKSEEDRSWLFQDLAIWNSAEARAHFGRHPVIFVTFKDIQGETYEEVYDSIVEVLARAYEQHRYLLDGGSLSPQYARLFSAILDRTANKAQYQDSLLELSRHLSAHHQERTVILIDEYDTPLQKAYATKHFDRIIAFFRSLFSAALKDNPHLFKGVLTGILRIAKENLFSGLNNLSVRSIFSKYYSDAFGFTEAEVRSLASAMGQPELAEDIAHWYDGYRFGETTIYNPWSVLSFAQSPEDGFKPYWVFTSADDILRPIVFERQAAVASGVETLLRGEVLEEEVSENLVLRDIDRNPTALWSLMLHSGYLTAREFRFEGELILAGLALPNLEMRHVFRQSIRSWLQYGLQNDPPSIREMMEALLTGDELTFETHLDTLVQRTFSFHDTGRMLPERVYQAFLLGLLVYLPETHEARSNRESGLGRYDVMISPRRAGLPGVVIECKQLRPDETVEHALASALRQIAARRYTTELEALGAEPILTYGLVFDGKRVWVSRGGKRRGRGAGHRKKENDKKA